jgi:hypothetical protein
MKPDLIPIVSIPQRIAYLRNHKVLLDVDLAELYGVQTKVFLQTIKRNINRFPSDFMFQLDAGEWKILRSQSVTSSLKHGGRRYAPYAFTEQGVAMLSSVLSSPQAIAVNIEIMRTFVRLREVILSNKDLAHRLDELESKADLIEVKHDNFEHNTRVQLKQVLEAIRKLSTPPEPAKKRSIGFVTHDEPPATPKAKAAAKGKK